MRLAVLGSPVAHSLSPAIHSAALAAAGLPGTYEARDVDAAGFAAALEEMRTGGLDGASVTMPHKGLAFSSVDRCAPVASRARAVNTLVRVGHDVAGHNTDIPGIRDAWRHNGLDPEGPVVILGSGGAAAAALLALEHRPLTVAARRPEAAKSLIGEIGVAATVTDLSVRPAGATVVNATPIGMAGEALPALLLEGSVGLFEMVYASGPTPAELEMKTRGLPVSSGPDLLVAQAVVAFRLWTGRHVPESVMRQAITAAR